MNIVYFSQYTHCIFKSCPTQFITKLTCCVNEIVVNQYLASDFVIIMVSPGTHLVKNHDLGFYVTRQLV